CTFMLDTRSWYGIVVSGRMFYQDPIYLFQFIIFIIMPLSDVRDRMLVWDCPIRSGLMYRIIRWIDPFSAPFLPSVKRRHVVELHLGVGGSPVKNIVKKIDVCFDIFRGGPVRTLPVPNRDPVLCGEKSISLLRRQISFFDPPWITGDFFI